MANPKNPVRAARQAGRQQIRAAKDIKRTAVQQAKVAKIQGRTAQKLAKIADKTAAIAPKTTAPKTAGSSKPAPKTGLTGKDLLTYGVKPKAAAPAAKGPSYAPFKSEAAKKQSQQMTADAKRRKAEAEKRQQEAAKKKAADEASKKKSTEKKKSSSSNNWIDDEWKKKGFTRGKDGKVRNAQGQTPEEAEAQRVKDMFLQPGETRENTLPYTFTEQAKRDAAKKAAMEGIQSIYNRIKSTTGTAAPGSSKPTFDQRFLDMGPKYKKGGNVKSRMSKTKKRK